MRADDKRAVYDAMKMLAWSIRFVALLALVVLTWSPNGRAFGRWIDLEGAVTATKAFVTSWKSLGLTPAGLLAALV